MTFFVSGSRATASARIFSLAARSAVDDGVRQRLRDDALVLDQVFHRLGIVLLAPGFADDVAGGAGVFDNRLEIGREVRPGRLVDDQLARRRGLVPAGRVVILRGALQAELAVEIGSDEFGGIDHAALERREDFAGRQQAHIHAERLIDATGQARECAS